MQGATVIPDDHVILVQLPVLYRLETSISFIQSFNRELQLNSIKDCRSRNNAQQ